MTKEEFVKAAFARLPRRPIVDAVDLECINRILEECYDLDFTLDDAVLSAIYTEHVTPELPEEFACRKISEIYRKYKKTKIFPKIDIDNLLSD